MQFRGISLTKLSSEFFESEKSGGILLMTCTAVSLLLANSPVAVDYGHLWHYELGGHNSEFWINDGLMAIFFLLIGLELKREIIAGELSSLKSASLPIFAAVGGMIVPAGLYLAFNYGTPTQTGAGIPMATDIAFAIGILSLLGSRVHSSLKVFLTALAVIDDLGAILVIAVFYTSSFSMMNLAIAFTIFLSLLLMNKLRVNMLLLYLIGGVAMWYFMLKSGVHPTIGGVMLAFAIPFNKKDEHSLSSVLQHRLHRPVAFIILPLFALANTSITVSSDWLSDFASQSSIGIFAGLILGKPLGILLFSYAAVSRGICLLPRESNWKQILGIGMIAGIGFTMSIFITLLAFTDDEHIASAKMSVLISSFVAGVIGYFWLRSTMKENSR